MDILVWISVKVIWYSGYQSHHGFLVVFGAFNQAKVVLVNTAFDSDPLVLLESFLLLHLTAFHDFCHFVDGDHLYRFEVDTAQAL